MTDTQSTAPRLGDTRMTDTQITATRSAGQQSAAPRSAGPQSTATRSAGQQSAAPRSAGPQSTATRSAGQQSDAPRLGDTRMTAPQSAGPRSAGQQSTAPRSAGPQSAAPPMTVTRSAGQQTAVTQSGAEERYTIISSDCHAGGNMAAYEEYLDPAWRDEFKAWRGAYRNPYRDLQDDGRSRNWDDERRLAEQHSDGIVAEITFPNTVPPFYPTGALVARPPSDRADYERRLAGIACHNRWLLDWCARYPDQRCGLPQIFVEDLDDAISTLEWAAAEGFRSFLLPHIPPDSDLPGFWHPQWDRLWAAVADLGLVMTQHGGNGGPDYGDAPAAGVIFLMEVPFFSHRNLAHLIMSGVFERYPTLRYVMTEQGVAWLVEELRRMDGYHRQMRSGRVGELGFAAEIVLPLRPSEYFNRNVWIGASFPSPREAEAIRTIGVHKAMWGSDYPHHEGTYPYSLESLRRAFSDWPADDLRAVLGANAAKLYGFNLDRLAPLAAEHGPTPAQVAEPLADIPAKATSPAFFKP